MLRRLRLAALAPLVSVCTLILFATQTPAARAADLEESLRSALAEVDAAKAAKEESAGEAKPAEAAKAPAEDAAKTAAAAEAAKPQAAAAATEEKPRSKYPPYSEVLKDAQKISGLITLYRKDDRLLAELEARNLNRDLIVLITIARGIGQTPIVGGFSWQFGDDAVWQFRRAGERIHLVRRNVRFTADKGSPDDKAVAVAYTDSVLFSLPIVTRSPSGALCRRSHAGVHERLAADFQRAARLHVLGDKIDLGGDRGLSQEHRIGRWPRPTRRAAWRTSIRCRTLAA